MVAERTRDGGGPLAGMEWPARVAGLYSWVRHGGICPEQIVANASPLNRLSTARWRGCSTGACGVCLIRALEAVLGGGMAHYLTRTFFHFSVEAL